MAQFILDGYSCYVRQVGRGARRVGVFFYRGAAFGKREIPLAIGISPEDVAADIVKRLPPDAMPEMPVADRERIQAQMRADFPSFVAGCEAD